jgi:hypothetical protein
VVRRAVLDLSGEELDEVVMRRFVAELHRLDDAQRRLLAGRGRRAGHPGPNRDAAAPRTRRPRHR